MISRIKIMLSAARHRRAKNDSAAVFAEARARSRLSTAEADKLAIEETHKARYARGCGR
jgi:hypothetical protein